MNSEERVGEWKKCNENEDFGMRIVIISEFIPIFAHRMRAKVLLKRK